MDLKRWVENWNQSTELLRHNFRSIDRSDILVFTAGFLFSLPILVQLEIPKVFFMFAENHIRLVGIEESRNLVHQYTVAFTGDVDHHQSLPCLMEKIMESDPSFRMNSKQTYFSESNCFLFNKNSLNLTQCPMDHSIFCKKASETVHVVNSSLVWALLRDFKTIYSGDKTNREHLSSLFNNLLLDLKSGLSMANNNTEVLGDQKRPYIIWVAGVIVGFRDQLKLDLTSLNMLNIDTVIITSILDKNRCVLAITFEYEKTTYIRFPFCLPIRGTIFYDKALVIDILLDTQPIIFSQFVAVPVCYNSLKHTVATVAAGLDQIDKIDLVLSWFRESMSPNAAGKFQFYVLGHLSAHVGHVNLDFSHLSSASLSDGKKVLVYKQKVKKRRGTDCFVFHLYGRTAKAENCSMSSEINLLNTNKISWLAEIRPC